MFYRIIVIKSVSKNKISNFLLMNPLQPLSLEQLSLNRYPVTHDKSLKAWNAADELLLEHIQSLFEQQKLSLSSLNCLIVNDQFGALSISLNEVSPLFWTDSYLSQKAIQRNQQSNLENNIKASPFSPSQQSNQQKFDLVIIRIPKHNSLLKYQLEQIKTHIHRKTIIVAGGMTKEIHNSNIKIFESVLGKTTTSLAKKKARLIFSQFEQSHSDATASQELKYYTLPQYQVTACGLAGVFSRDKLDIGTQVLLEHLPEVNQGERVIDLGCGNGVIGAIIAKSQPLCQLLLSDESQLAVESAKLTFIKNQLSNADFIHTDVLHGVERNSFDHILCNPPFHQQNVQTLDIAINMFKQSAQCLKSIGELRVVANRHLKYLPLLKRYFSQVSSISNNAKFTVWLAKKSKLN